MRISAIHRACFAQPFRPFTLCLVDGRRFEVRHTEFCALSPTERTVAITDADRSVEIIDPALVTSISLGNGEATASG